MPFWKKMFNKRQGVYYPRAVGLREAGESRPRGVHPRTHEAG